MPRPAVNKTYELVHSDLFYWENAIQSNQVEQYASQIIIFYNLKFTDVAIQQLSN
jgi:hypothetical protein